MDLLFKRYANPYIFLDSMIKNRRFEDFVIKFAKTITKEKEDQQNWEFFLHKVWNGTYQEFIDDLEITKRNLNMSKEREREIIEHSNYIMDNFKPNV